MARQLRIEYPGAFYHIIQRGSERRDIFISDQHRRKSLEYINLAAKRCDIKIHTFLSYG